jgi:hypothetical protein
MPLARLENFLKNLNGNTLYVDPNELDATDSIENRGNSKLRPFKTIQRALIEAARFAYVAGSDNDLFDQTTIMISPGTHYIDNRPGYYVDSSSPPKFRDINSAEQSITEFNILSNFDLTDSQNELYIYNSIDGGVILPKGTSLVASDLRKTKIRPLFVPDPAQSEIQKSAIFRLTGSCYFFGFTIYDADPLGKVYNTYSTTTVTPSFSHHKLTAFEYADGVNKVSDTGHTDLEMYYYKVAKGFGQQSGRSILDGYLNLQPNVDEYRIVGELGVGSINITSVISGDGSNGTNVITVTTETEHGLSALTPILISGVGINEGSPTTTEYNGNFLVAQVLSPTQFTYLTLAIPTGTLQPSTNGAAVKVISDTTTSSSPYVFNCSLKSVYGMNGLHADGSKSTGFRSMVTAQFTGISLQKDDRAFVQYEPTSGSYQNQESFGVTKFLHQDINSIYQPDWSSFHIKASNSAFIQCVSIFAIGYANQFVADDGGDQSITNSNSNFGERALFSKGFKQTAFPKDDNGFITHIIPPKDVFVEDQNINCYSINVGLTTSLASVNGNTRVYLNGYSDILSPPPSKFRGYSVGGREDDKIYYTSLNTGIEYYANISPNYKIDTNITSINSVNNQLTLASVAGISTGLAVKIVGFSTLGLPDGIENNTTYFVRPVIGNNVRIYENLPSCNADTENIGDTAVDIKNSIGLTSDSLYLVSKVSDLSAGDVGSPIQWDSANNNWYLKITLGSPNFISNLTSFTSTPQIYLKRILDTRINDDRIYRVRYVIPKESQNASVPLNGFILQKSGRVLNSSYPQASNADLSSETGDVLSTVRNKNVVIDAWYSAETATIVTKNPHNLKVGNKISIYNLKSSNEPAPIGIGTGTGFNGSFVVASVVNNLTFTYAVTRDPGTITAGISSTANWLSTRDCAQTSNFRVPPYTIYEDFRTNLPYFTCDQIENQYQISSIKEIQRYTQGSLDGIYYINLDSFKNTPTVAPFNTSEYKLGQNLNNIIPTVDFDNLTVDPDPSTTVASRTTIGKVDINTPYLSSTKESIIEYFKDFDLGKKITQITKSGSNVTITTSVDHGLGGIRRVVSDSLGSGYLNGTYYDIPLCGGTGSNATVNVKVSGGTPTTFEIANPGSGYSVNDTLTIKGIPGSTNSTTVTIPANVGLNFSTNDSDTIQILGAKNTGNNGAFVISSITANTITYTNASGATESTTNAVLIMSGTGYPVISTSYNSTTDITTITTSTNTPYSFSSGNKVIFNNSIEIFTVLTVDNINEFTVNGNASSADRVYSIGLIPTLKDSNSLNENLNTRNFAAYAGYKSRLGQSITSASTTFSIDNIQGLKKGDFIQVANEIMLVTNINGNTIIAKRALFGTPAVDHINHTSIKTISITPVESRRPSILRASSHTFEYTGFGPGNYSTAMPTNQTKVLDDTEAIISQSLSNRGGSVLYTGMNSNGEFFIGKKKFNAATGEEVQPLGTLETEIVTDFDLLTVNDIVVNKELDASTANVKIKDLYVSGISTFVGVSTFKSGINVTGISTFNSGLDVTGTTTINGALNVTGDITAFYVPSDKNWKDNITPIPDALDKVLSISGNTFDWNEKSPQFGKDAGVIAQEIQEVLPEAVTEREDGHLSVSYTKIVPLLIEAIKELKAEINQLKGGK